MSNPVSRIILTIQPRALYVDPLILLIEVYISDRRRGIRELVGYANGFEERRNDKVHVLAWVGKETDHAEECEGCHGTRVIVARKTCLGAVEARRDVYEGIRI